LLQDVHCADTEALIALPACLCNGGVCAFYLFSFAFLLFAAPSSSLGPCGCKWLWGGRQGLAYLHDDEREKKVIYRDFKTSNILLDKVLYCTVLYSTVLYHTVLYCTVLHCTVLFAFTGYRTRAAFTYVPFCCV